MVFLHKWEIDGLIKHGRFQSSVSRMRSMRYREKVWFVTSAFLGALQNSGKRLLAT
jgi:hypothetical protein